MNAPWALTVPGRAATTVAVRHRRAGSAWAPARVIADALLSVRRSGSYAIAPVAIP